jgi:glucose-1-phosphatase
MEIANIKNIIFDLGGVILNLNPGRSLHGFSRACGLSVDELGKIVQQNRQLFLDYETGRIDSKRFREEVSGIIRYQMGTEDFDCAWNSILMDVPEERVRLLERLRPKYRLFLLSNTNDIHASRVDELLAASACTTGLMDWFEKVYYSHLINKRKPEPEAFLHVLEENDLVPSETLFIDDTIINIEGAKLAGMHVLHVEANNPRLEFLLNEGDTF